MERPDNTVQTRRGHAQRCVHIFDPQFGLMVPLLRDDHWWCCVFNLRDRRIDIVSSIESFYVVNQLQQFVISLRELLQHILAYCGGNISVSEFDVIHHKLPQQSSRDPESSGIFVIKFMKYWDGRMTSSITQESINQVRRQLVVQWVMHEKNDIKPMIDP